LFTPKMVSMKIKRAAKMRGIPSLPADKSISHRSALIASVANGTTSIENFSASADCASSLSALRQLGVRTEQDGSQLLIHGKGKNGFSCSEDPLDCGNSGTTIRLLSGVLAGQEFDSTLTGDSSLLARPMERVAGPLSMMGASVTTTDGRAPLHIRGRRPLKAIEYQLPVASAQIKSAILLAGMFAEGTTTVIEPVQTRDHTERMLRWFGAEVTRETNGEGSRISISGSQDLTAGFIKVPADVSAAAFFIVAAACLPESEISLENVGINPTRTGVMDVLKGLGVRISIENTRAECNEPVATVRVMGGIDHDVRANPARIGGTLIANLIDEIPILAILGTQLPKGLEVRAAAELRHKESDRISSICKNLALMGADVTEFPDGFYVSRSDLHGAVIDSFGDHRIAMAFAIAGLLADGDTVIKGPECADISFPGFFQTLRGVVM
jgi:3-phosphoshikimate 1-carboxyvinyltransferase